MKAEQTGRLGYTFLQCDSRFRPHETFAFLVEVTDMYLSCEKGRDIQGERYEGRIRTEGKYGCIGSFSGHVFEAEIEAPFGKTSLKFLVNDSMHGQSAAYLPCHSRN